MVGSWVSLVREFDLTLEKLHHLLNLEMYEIHFYTGLGMAVTLPSCFKHVYGFRHSGGLVVGGWLGFENRWSESVPSAQPPSSVVKILAHVFAA